MKPCCAVAAVFVALMALLSSPVSAQDEARARLSFESASEMDCPSEQVFRGRVAARLGYDPFVEEAGLHVLVAFRSGDGGPRVEIRTTRENHQDGVRQLDGVGACADLTDDAVLAVSIAIDPAVLVRPMVAQPVSSPAVEPQEPPDEMVSQAVPEPPPARSPSALPSQPEQAEPDEQLEEETDWFVRGALGTLVSVGAAPAVNLGFALSLEIGFQSFFVGLGGRADLPGSIRVGTGQVEGNLLVGELSLCGRFSSVYTCAVGQGGAFRGAGREVEEAAQVLRPHGNLGGRVGVEINLDDALHIRGQLDILAALTRTTLLLGDEPIWTTPPVSASLGVFLAVHFL